MEDTGGSGHRWRFCRLGGFDQVRLETAEDIRRLGNLDQKLWAALSCPVDGLEFDSRALEMLDGDKDGRVRVQEILAAAGWISHVLADMDTFFAGADTLPLAAIDESHAEGRQLLASARQLLSYLGKPRAESLSIEDVCCTNTLLHGSGFNGDGIITVQLSGEDSLQKLITEIMDCVGSDQDRSGLPGISLERVETFFKAAGLYAQWWERASESSVILPYGGQTDAAAEVYHRLKNKIEDYFTRCRLAAFDDKAEASLNPSQVNYQGLAVLDLAAATAEIACFPLARIEGGRPLPLREGINPAWTEDVEKFSALLIAPLFGPIPHLQEGQWHEIKKTLLPYEAWQAEKAGAEVELLGIERVRKILSGTGKSQLEKLIQQDLLLAEQVDGLDKVIKLVFLNRHFFRLLNNFVSFRDFYDKRQKAVFQAGTLYIDGRSCELCIEVKNVENHSALAQLSRTYLAYCECKRQEGRQRIFIAAAFTGGDSDNLMIGRNGVFYDIHGRDWDATIVKIIDHPIGVSQAFWAPYKRIGRMIGEQIEKFASAKDKAVDSKAGAGLASVASKPTSSTGPPLPFDVGKFAGIFAALGLALGALGTAVASIFGVFLSLPVWQMPLAVAGVMLAVSGPSMLIAYLKLRQRNLGPMLDANGWAVNTKARINIPFGATLTKVATLPQGSERSLADPFAEKKTPWKRWAFLLFLLVALGFAWNKGYIKQWGRQLEKASTPIVEMQSAPNKK